MTEIDPMDAPRVCLLCEETFTLGEMYPGKTYTDPMQCPYCRSDETSALPSDQREA